MYKLFSNIILRTPKFSLNNFEHFVSGKKSIKDYSKQNFFQEALYIASPELFSETQKWLNGLIKDTSRQEKIEQSLYKYLARMSTRCTPFGLFAGVTLLKLGGKNEQQNGTKIKYRDTRLDMNFACALGQHCSMQEGIINQLKFYPNSSLYTIKDRCRYVEYTYGNKNHRKYKITAVDSNVYLNKILKHSKNGSLIKELAAIIVEEDIAYNEAESFINELIEAQVLVSELEPLITQTNYLSFLIEKLKKIDNTISIVEKLKNVENILFDLDKQPVGVKISEYYDKIKSIIDNLQISYDEKFLFQTDMLISDISVDFKVELADKVLEGIEVLNRLSIPSQETNISKFASEFYKRFEERELSLVEVLDPEIGIGYPVATGAELDLAPLIDDLLLPRNSSGNYQIRWNLVQTFLLKRYQQSIKNNDFITELTYDDLKQFSFTENDLPSTISAVIQLLPAEEQGGEERIFLNTAGGNSALCLIGRFCHLSDSLYNYAKEIAQKEKELAGDAIVAEIVHLPEARTGNILMHPRFYDYEIPYLAQSSVGKGFKIEISDIMISVKHHEIFLRSKKLNKQIIPRLSNAHNYSVNSLPVYRFLSDMQLQGKRGGFSFNWGVFANEYFFLPRVIFKNLILSLATWNIRNKTIEHLFKIKDEKKLLKNVKKWCDDNRIPRWVTLADKDNELVIDMTSVLSVKTLLNLIKRRSGFILKEYLNCPEYGSVKDRDGNIYANQIILSFYKKNPDNNVNTNK
ncbi:MAG: lantibiotic dehydratase family protein [Bacteroidetes bacterium]|nr:lantibiotic dehydratase family protein [Bacteroidota bacterium]